MPLSRIIQTVFCFVFLQIKCSSSGTQDVLENANSEYEDADEEYEPIRYKNSHCTFRSEGTGVGAMNEDYDLDAEALESTLIRPLPSTPPKSVDQEEDYEYLCQSGEPKKE